MAERHRKPRKTNRCTPLPSLSQKIKTAVSLQAGLGSNTFIPPGPDQQRRNVHSAALASSDLRHRDNCCCLSDRQKRRSVFDKTNCVAARRVRSGDLHPAVAFYPKIGVTVKPLPCAQIGGPLLFAPPPPLLLLLLARQWRRSVRKLGS